MKAKETVITTCNDCLHNHTYIFEDGFHDGKAGNHCDLLAELPKGCPKKDISAQAEISFKAGQQDELKEVEEWVKTHTTSMNTNMSGISLDGKEWQAFLKSRKSEVRK